MSDLNLDRLLKNIDFEVSGEGVRLKFYGISYFLTETEVRSILTSVHRIHERIGMLKKEKEDLVSKTKEETIAILTKKDFLTPIKIEAGK